MGVRGNDNRILGPGEGCILNTSPEAPCRCLGVTRGLLVEKNYASPIPGKNIIFSYTSELHIYIGNIFILYGYEICFFYMDINMHK